MRLAELRSPGALLAVLRNNTGTLTTKSLSSRRGKIIITEWGKCCNMETRWVVMGKLREGSLTQSWGTKEGFSEWIGMGWGPEGVGFLVERWTVVGGKLGSGIPCRLMLSPETNACTSPGILNIQEVERENPQALQFQESRVCHHPFAMQVLHRARSQAPLLDPHHFLKGGYWNLPVTERALSSQAISLRSQRWVVELSCETSGPLTLMPGHFTIKFKYLNFR